jgi:hypothetical protein
MQMVGSAAKDSGMAGVFYGMQPFDVDAAFAAGKGENGDEDEENGGENGEDR